MSDRSRRAGSYGRASGEPLLDELAAQSSELAKRWALALIADAPPEEIAAVDLALIASEGPALVDRVLASAAQGEDLAAAAPPAGLAAVAGAGSAGELARALEALRSVLWEAAVEASPRARSDTRAARRLLETGEALAAACSELLAAALDAPAPERMEGEAAQELAQPARPAARAPAGAEVVIVDERGGGLPGAARPRAEHLERAAEPEESPFAPAISAHDARPGHEAHPTKGPAAWIDSIGARLSISQTDRRPFAVLLVELLEPFAPSGTAARRPTLESLLDERLRGPDGLSLTQERAGRYWLVAPGSDRAGAERLRTRLQDALTSGRGVAAVAIGVAVFPDDAADAPGLAAQADLDLYATRSQSTPAHGRRRT